MIICTIFLVLLLLNALTTRKDTAIFYTRSAILALLSACFICYNNLFVMNLENIFAFFEQLVNGATLTQNISIPITRYSVTNCSAILFLFFFGSVILAYFLSWSKSWLPISNIRLRIFLYKIANKLSIKQYFYFVYNTFLLPFYTTILQWKQPLINFIHLSLAILLVFISILINSVNISPYALLFTILSLSSIIMLLLCIINTPDSKVSILETIKITIRFWKYIFLFLFLFKILMSISVYLFTLGLDIDFIDIKYGFYIKYYIYIACLYPSLYVMHVLREISKLSILDDHSYVVLHKGKFYVDYNKLNHIKTKPKPDLSLLSVQLTVLQFLTLTSGFVVFQSFVLPVYTEKGPQLYSYLAKEASTRFYEYMQYKSSNSITKRGFFFSKKSFSPELFPPVYNSPNKICFIKIYFAKSYVNNNTILRMTKHAFKITSIQEAAKLAFKPEVCKSTTIEQYFSYGLSKNDLCSLNNKINALPSKAKLELIQAIKCLSTIEKSRIIIYYNGLSKVDKYSFLNKVISTFNDKNTNNKLLIPNNEINLAGLEHKETYHLTKTKSNKLYDLYVGLPVIDCNPYIFSASFNYDDLDLDIKYDNVNKSDDPDWVAKISQDPDRIRYIKTMEEYEEETNQSLVPSSLVDEDRIVIYGSDDELYSRKKQKTIDTRRKKNSMIEKLEAEKIMNENIPPVLHGTYIQDAFDDAYTNTTIKGEYIEKKAIKIALRKLKHKINNYSQFTYESNRQKGILKRYLENIKNFNIEIDKNKKHDVKNVLTKQDLDWLRACGFPADQDPISYYDIEKITIDQYNILEDETSAIVFTILAHYFDADNWLICPESRQPNKRIPDVAIKGCFREDLYLKFFIENKKYKGASFNDILKQLSDSIELSLDINGESGLESYDFIGSNCYGISHQGTRVAFMEIIRKDLNLTENNIPNYKNIIPLTLDLMDTGGDSVMSRNTEFMELQAEMKKYCIKEDSCMFNYENMEGSLLYEGYVNSNRYYVLDLIEHASTVHKVFTWISRHPARAVLNER